jgi:hypothetical protein
MAAPLAKQIQRAETMIKEGQGTIDLRYHNCDDIRCLQQNY